MLVRLAVFTAVVAVTLLPSAARADNPVLVATVGLGDGYNISLKDASGNAVKHLDPGTYTIQVHDESTIHNFHLFGAGVDDSTPIGDTADTTWMVTLQNGTYTYRCDAHPTIMRGTFTVGTVTPPPSPAKLIGSVGPGRKIALRNANGTKLTRLAGGTKVAITVTDRSRVDNFHLRGPGVNKATGVRFRGRVAWQLTVRTGAYAYRSDTHRSLRGTFIVTASG